MRFLIAETDRPLVIDADGLNALAGQTDLLADLQRPVILTPHPGEFARLAGKDVAAVQADRVEQAAALASVSEPLVVVLKGAGTVVTEGRRYYVNTTGNPGMATGGTGDVLTGVIAALIGQKLPGLRGRPVRRLHPRSGGRHRPRPARRGRHDRRRHRRRPARRLRALDARSGSGHINRVLTARNRHAPAGLAPPDEPVRR